MERKVSRGPRNTDLAPSLFLIYITKPSPSARTTLYEDHTLRQEDYVLGLHQGKGTQEDWWKQ